MPAAQQTAVRPITFSCEGDALVGILEVPRRHGMRGVVVVVGGPQYRIGSHRQFVLLARALVARGYPVLRFDCRGMGDSEGESGGFETIGPDIAAAIRAFHAEVPGLREIVLWGLCDGATAAVFHAARAGGIAGLILANPWARTEQGLARSYVRHYYLQRLFQGAFWRRLLAGELNVGSAARDLVADLWRAVAPAGSQAGSRAAGAGQAGSLPDRLRSAFEAYSGPALLLLSGDDLTAREFAACCAGRDWRRILQRPEIARLDLPDADHTFSRRIWQDQVNTACGDWLDAMAPPDGPDPGAGHRVAGQPPSSAR